MTRHVIDLPAGWTDSIEARVALLPVLVERYGDAPWQIEQVMPMDDRVRVAITDDVPARRPAAQALDLAASIKGSEVGALAASLERLGTTLVEVDVDRNIATAARITPVTRRIRDLIASAFKVMPHEVEVTVITAATGLRSVVVHRAPLIPEATKRRAAWVTIQELLVPYDPDFRWNLIDRTATGQGLILKRIEDPLLHGFTYDEFLARVDWPDMPAWRFPVAISETGEVVYGGFQQQAVVGTTGAGKGSYLWAVLRGLAANEGLVKFYAIDPKDAEARACPGIWSRPPATTPDDWDELLADLVVALKARQGMTETDEDGEEYAIRATKITRETPAVVLLLDELSALGSLDTDAARKKRVMANLGIIASQGRSAGFVIVAGVQIPTIESMGPIREHLVARTALRTASKQHTDIVLGEGATEAGAEAHRIGASSAANGYKYSGQGYVLEDGKDGATRVRFPFTSDADLRALSKRYRAVVASMPPLHGVDDKAAPVPDFAEIPVPTVVRDEVLDIADLDLGDLL